MNLNFNQVAAVKQSAHFAYEEPTLSADTMTLQKYFEKMGANGVDDLKWIEKNQAAKQGQSNSKTIDFYDHTGVKDHRLNTFGRVDNDGGYSEDNSSSMRPLKQSTGGDPLNRLRSKEKPLRQSKVDGQRAL